MTAAGRGGPHGTGHEPIVPPATERLGRNGRGPVLIALLVLAAVLVAVVQPWALFGPGPGATGALPVDGPSEASGAVSTRPGASAGAGSPPVDGAPGGPGASGRPGSGGPTASGGGPGSGAGPGASPVASRTPPVETCAYPASWRVASIEDWSGKPARVWSAADVVRATGPADPSIPRNPIISDVVTAFGWCAPVAGADRPPFSATGTLFRLDDGVATPIPYARLEPAGPDALGELWTPPAPEGASPPPWPPGRYVIRIASPDGSYERFLGIEVAAGARAPGATATPGSSPDPSSRVPGGEPSVSGGPPGVPSPPSNGQSQTP